MPSTAHPTTASTASTTSTTSCTAATAARTAPSSTNGGAAPASTSTASTAPTAGHTAPTAPTAATTSATPATAPATSASPPPPEAAGPRGLLHDKRHAVLLELAYDVPRRRDHHVRGVAHGRAVDESEHNANGRRGRPHLVACSGPAGLVGPPLSDLLRAAHAHADVDDGDDEEPPPAPQPRHVELQREPLPVDQPDEDAQWGEERGEEKAGRREAPRRLGALGLPGELSPALEVGADDAVRAHPAPGHGRRCSASRTG